MSALTHRKNRVGIPFRLGVIRGGSPSWIDRFDTRMKEILDEAEVALTLIDGSLSRLKTFDHLIHTRIRAISTHSRIVTGLLSKLKRKTSEGIAYGSRRQTVVSLIRYG